MGNADRRWPLGLSTFSTRPRLSAITKLAQGIYSIETAPITAEERAEADLFYQSYGKALARWSAVESYLTSLFAQIANIHVSVASPIFNSAGSWRGKKAMICSLLQHSSGVPGYADAIKSIVCVADGYSKFRNTLAHDHIGFTKSGVQSHMRTFAILPHRYGALPEKIAVKSLVYRREIDNAAVNFHLLSSLIATACQYPPTDQLGAPERLALLASRLPSLAQADPPDPKVAAQFSLGLHQQPFPL